MPPHRRWGSSSFRHGDLVARLQGDQFAILVDGLREVGDATVFAGRVLAELVTAFPSRGREVFLSPSVGVAVSATGYATPSAVLRDAETALHRAKLLGKARYEVFDTAILESARAELQLEADFAGALDRGEFQVFYQPVHSPTSCHRASTRWISHSPVAFRRLKFHRRASAFGVRLPTFGT